MGTSISQEDDVIDPPPGRPFLSSLENLSPDDPFPVYEEQTDEINFEKDDFENIRAEAYQRKRKPYRFSRLPTAWLCDECRASIQKFDPHYHCFECGNYDLCIDCYSKGEEGGRHTHPNGSRTEDYLYHMKEPNWHLPQQLSMASAVSMVEVARRIFRHYAPRHFIGVRPRASDPTFYWMTYQQAYAFSVRIARSLMTLHNRYIASTDSLDDEEEQSESALPSRGVVGILTGIRICCPLLWFGSHFAGHAYATIPRIVTLDEKRAIVDECRPRVLFTERRLLGDVIKLWSDVVGEDEEEGEREAKGPVTVILLDDDVEIFLGAEREEQEEEEEEEGEGEIPAFDSSRLTVLSLSQFLALGDPLTDYGEDEDSEESLWEFEPVPCHYNDVAVLCFTSGTSGCPKGVVFKHKTWKLEVQKPFYDNPIVRLAYAPFSHLTGVHFVHSAFFNGGRVAMLSEGNLTHFFDDCRILRPTVISAFPRICGFVFDMFQLKVGQLKAQGVSGAEQRVYNEMGEIFGDRIVELRVGSAPCSLKVKRFMRRLCRCGVHDGYGITEVGGIASDHRIRSDVKYKILPCPELGYFPTDLPYPRGELIVKTELTQQIEYFHNPTATSARFDQDGYFHTGDVVELREGNRILIVDRRSNVIKLSQGEFISLESVEATLQFSPLLSQVVVFPNPAKTCFVSIIQVETMISSEDAIDEMRRTCSKHELPPWAVPVLAHVTMEELPLTAVKKKCRKRIKEIFGAELALMFSASMEMESSGFDFEAHLRELLGIRELDYDAVWGSLGGDSMSGVALVSTLRSLGIDIPYYRVRKMTLGALIARVEEKLAPVSPTTEPEIEEEGEGEDIGTETKSGWDSMYPSSSPDREPFVTCVEESAALARLVETFPPRDVVDEELEALAQTTVAPSEDDSSVRYTFFLTGGSGFLGFEVLRALCRDSEEMVDSVICLVRSTSLERFRTMLAEADLTKYVEAVEGDLEDPFFGLEMSDFQTISDRVDLILHVGAMVNHILPYQDHYAANVRSVYDVVRLSSGWKPIVFISSMSVFSTLSSSSKSHDIRAQKHQHHRGYGASKFVSDLLLSTHASSHCAVIRPPLIGPSALTGACNPRDWLCRSILSMFLSSSAPCENRNGEVPFDMISVDVLSALVANVAARCLRGTYSFTSPGINLSFENLTVSTILDYVERFYNEELYGKDARFSADFQRVGFDDWIRQLEAREKLPIGPFVDGMERRGCFGSSSFTEVEHPELDAFVEDCLEEMEMVMSYDGFVSFARELVRE